MAGPQTIGGPETEMSTVSKSLLFYQNQQNQQQSSDFQRQPESPYNQYRHQLELQQRMLPDASSRRPVITEFRCQVPNRAQEPQNQVTAGEVGIVVTSGGNGQGGGGGTGTEGESADGNTQSASTRRHRSKHRPLFRRLYNYIRNTIYGQKNKGGGKRFVFTIIISTNARTLDER